MSTQAEKRHRRVNITNTNIEPETVPIPPSPVLQDNTSLVAYHDSSVVFVPQGIIIGNELYTPESTVALGKGYEEPGVPVILGPDDAFNNSTQGAVLSPSEVYQDVTKQASKNVVVTNPTIVAEGNFNAPIIPGVLPPAANTTVSVAMEPIAIEITTPPPPSTVIAPAEAVSISNMISSVESVNKAVVAIPNANISSLNNIADSLAITNDAAEAAKNANITALSTAVEGLINVNDTATGVQIINVAESAMAVNDATTTIPSATSAAIGSALENLYITNDVATSTVAVTSMAVGSAAENLYITDDVAKSTVAATSAAAGNALENLYITEDVANSTVAVTTASLSKAVEGLINVNDTATGIQIINVAESAMAVNDTATGVQIINVADSAMAVNDASAAAQAATSVTPVQVASESMYSEDYPVSPYQSGITTELPMPVGPYGFEDESSGMSVPVDMGAATFSLGSVGKTVIPVKSDPNLPANSVFNNTKTVNFDSVTVTAGSEAVTDFTKTDLEKALDVGGKQAIAQQMAEKVQNVGVLGILNGEHTLGMPSSPSLDLNGAPADVFNLSSIGITLPSAPSMQAKKAKYFGYLALTSSTSATAVSLLFQYFPEQVKVNRSRNNTAEATPYSNFPFTHDVSANPITFNLSVLFNDYFEYTDTNNRGKICTDNEAIISMLLQPEAFNYEGIWTINLGYEPFVLREVLIDSIDVEESFMSPDSNQVGRLQASIQGKFYNRIEVPEAIFRKPPGKPKPIDPKGCYTLSNHTIERMKKANIPLE